MTIDIPDELDRLLSNAWEIENQSLVVACPTPELASQLTHQLYTDNSDDVFHIEHYPCTNDEEGRVEYYALLIRRLSYDRDVGWCSADLSNEPEFDLTEYRGHDPDQSDLTAYTTQTRRFAVCAETVFDPHHNYTVLGRIAELDVSEYDSLTDAARDAVEIAVEAMPEQLDDLVDSEFNVLVIEDNAWVPVRDLTEDHDTPE